MNKKLSLPLFLSFLIIFAFFAPACDQVSSLTDQVMGAIGLGNDKTKDNSSNKDSKKRKLIKRDRKQKKDRSSKTGKLPLSKNKKQDKDIIITRSDDSDKQDIKTTDLKTAKAPKFKVEAPVHVLKRVGGVARFIFADDKYIYMDFPQHFAIYNSDLELLATKPITYPLKEVKKFVKDAKIYIYLKEENDVLEILELKTVTNNNKTIYTLEEIASNEMEHPFYWVNANLIAVFLNSKIQFLDFSDLKKIKIFNETPVSRVTTAIALKNHLFLSRDQFLDILNLNNFNLISSIRVGRKFGFLGMKRTENGPDLILSYLDAKDAITGIQFLRLTKDFSGISDFGDNIDLALPLKKYTFDIQDQIIIGQEAPLNNSKSTTSFASKDSNEVTPIQLFSLKYKRFLRGPLGSETKLQAWSLNRNYLYLVDDKKITINKIIIDDKVIAQSRNINKIINNTANTPLAQIGATKIIRDEYTLDTKQQLDFMSDSRKIVMLDQNHIIAFENTKDGKNHSIYTTASFTADDIQLKEPDGSQLDLYTDLIPTDFGLFAYSNKSDKFYFMDVELSAMKLLKIKPQNMVSWTHFSTKEGEALIIAAKNESRPKQPPNYSVEFYLLKSPDNLQLKGSVIKKDPPFVFYVPDNQIVVLTKNEMDLYNWNTILSPVSKTDSKTKKGKKSKKPAKPQGITPEETVPLTNIQDEIVALKVAPSFDIVYALIRDEKDRYKIYVMDIFEVTNNAIMQDFDITPNQFKGASFSKEGRLFILPSNEGTLFYDVSKIYQIKEVAHWPLLSYHVDVAAKGQYICVALGYKGIYCGDLLF